MLQKCSRKYTLVPIAVFQWQQSVTKGACYENSNENHSWKDLRYGPGMEIENEVVTQYAIRFE